MYISVAGLAHTAIGGSIPSPIQLFADAFTTLSPFRSHFLPYRLSTISVALLVVTVLLCLLFFFLHLLPIVEIRQDTVFQCRSALGSVNILIRQVKPSSVIRPFASHHSLLTFVDSICRYSLFQSFIFGPTI